MKASSSSPRRVLVPFTGGVASYAALWWTIDAHHDDDDDLLPPYEAWLFYADGYAPTIDVERREHAAVRRAFADVRDARGEPMWHRDDGGGEARYRFESRSIERRGDVEQLTRAAVDAARARRCCAIVWSVFGGADDDEQRRGRHHYERLRSAPPDDVLFLFPFHTPLDALRCLVDGARRSWNVQHALSLRYQRHAAAASNGTAMTRRKRSSSARAAAAVPTALIRSCGPCLPTRVLELAHSCDADDDRRAAAADAIVGASQFRSPLLSENCTDANCASCVTWRARIDQLIGIDGWLRAYDGRVDVDWHQLPHLNVTSDERRRGDDDGASCYDMASRDDEASIRSGRGGGGDDNALLWFDGIIDGASTKTSAACRRGGGGFDLDAVLRRVRGDAPSGESIAAADDDRSCFDFDENGSMIEVQVYDEGAAMYGGDWETDDVIDYGD